MSQTPYQEAKTNEIADELLKQIQNSTAPWIKPWKPFEAMANMPMNPVTGTVYRGINALLLEGHGKIDPRWMTFNNIKEKEYRLKPGSKGQIIEFWKWTDKVAKKDDNGLPILGLDGKVLKEEVKRSRPLVKYSYVFNATDITLENGEPLPPLEQNETLEKLQEFQVEERAEKLLAASKARIFEDQRDKNFYNVLTDEIHLTPKASFDTSLYFYSTALHELGHWTLHPSRMNRVSGPFGSEEYAIEELRAEIASWLLARETGLPHDPSQHASYVKFWARTVEDNPQVLRAAIKDAEKIVQYVLDLERQQEMGQEQPAIAPGAPEPQTEEIIAAQETFEEFQEMVSEEIALEPGASEPLFQINTEDFPFLPSIYQELQELNMDYEESENTYTLQRKGLFLTINNTEQDRLIQCFFTPNYRNEGTDELRIILTDGLYPFTAAFTINENNEFFIKDYNHPLIFPSLAREEDGPIDHSTRNEALIKLLHKINSQGLSLTPRFEQNTNFSYEPQESAITQEVPSSEKVKFETLEPMPKKALAIYENLREQIGGTMETDNENFLFKPIKDRYKEYFSIKTTRFTPDELSFITPFDKIEGVKEFVSISIYNDGGLGQIDPDIHQWAELGFFMAIGQDNSIRMVPPFPQGYKGIKNAKEYQNAEGIDFVCDNILNKYEMATGVKMVPEESYKNVASEITYLNAPYRDRVEVKALGALWDSEARSWYAPKGTNLEPLAKWLIKIPEIDAGPPEITDKKVYLSVKYAERHEAKNLGAKWDNEVRSWFVAEGKDIKPFKKWVVEEKAAEKGSDLSGEGQDKTAASLEKVAVEKENKIYLHVPFSEKDEAKSLGAMWDTQEKLWYVTADKDFESFKKWEITDQAIVAESPNLDPIQEFKELIVSKGFQLEGDPILDGKNHMLPLQGAAPGINDGYYMGHLGEKPYGELYNFHFGQKIDWVYSGQKLSEDEIEKSKIEREEKVATREREKTNDQTIATLKAQDKIKRYRKNKAKDLEGFTYCNIKGITAPEGVLYKKYREKITLLVPGYSTPKIDPLEPHKSVQTIQSITADCVKTLEQGCDKKGAMFIINPEDPSQTLEKVYEKWVSDGEWPEKKPVVLITEDLETAETLNKVTGLTAVCAFEPRNFEHVGASLASVYPGVDLAYCPNNYFPLDKTYGVQDAQKASFITGGKVIVPDLTKEESEKLLFSFNDIAFSRGHDEVKKQVFSALGMKLTDSNEKEAAIEGPKVNTGLMR